MKRAGFTLIEVMAAVALSGTIALLAFSVARTGFDTEAAVHERNEVNAAEVQLRTMLTDALRHPAESGGAAMNDTLFAIRDNGIEFTSRDAHITLAVVDTTLVLQDSLVTVVVPGVTAMHARVLDRTRDVTWLNEWTALGRVPAAVRLDFEGRHHPAPIIVHTALEPVL